MVRIFPNLEALSRATADRVVESARAAISQRDRFSIALSGGHTPTRAYQMLAEEPCVSQVDWRKVHVFWGDERNVPVDNKDSNEGAAHSALLDSVPIPASQIHPMFMGGTNGEAAVAYEKLLHEFFGKDGPTFDLVLLGMGPDGHTASLFPDAGNLDSEAWVIAAETNVWAVHDRITLTAKAISLARELVFEIDGADKAGVLKSIIEEDGSYPAGAVAARSKDVTWMLTELAACELEDRPRGMQ